MTLDKVYLGFLMIRLMYHSSKITKSKGDLVMPALSERAADLVLSGTVDFQQVQNQMPRKKRRE